MVEINVTNCQIDVTEGIGLENFCVFGKEISQWTISITLKSLDQKTSESSGILMKKSSVTKSVKQYQYIGCESALSSSSVVLRNKTNSYWM